MLSNVSVTTSCTMEQRLLRIKPAATFHALETVLKCVAQETDCLSTPPMEHQRSTNHPRSRPPACPQTGCTRDVFKTTSPQRKIPTRSSPPSHTWCGTMPATLQYHALHNARPLVSTLQVWSTAQNASAVTSRTSKSPQLRVFPPTLMQLNSTPAALSRKSFPTLSATPSVPVMGLISADQET